MFLHSSKKKMLVMSLVVCVAGLLIFLGAHFTNAQAGASITITSPNGGETFDRGKTYNITWASNALPAADTIWIQYLDIAGTYGAITTVPASTNSYSWTVPAWLKPGKYRIHLEVQGNHVPSTKIAEDWSNNFFDVSSAPAVIPSPVPSTQASPSPMPVITVTSPNGGETFSKGQTVSVTWASSVELPKSDRVYIQYENSNGARTNVAIRWASETSYAWTVPFVQGNYKIVVSYEGRIADKSDNFFSVVDPLVYTPLPTPSSPVIFSKEPIKVTWPNGSENFRVGQTINITWQTSTNLPDSDDIVILFGDRDNSGLFAPIGYVPANEHSYMWVIPNNTVPDDYRVIVRYLNGNNYLDASDRFFHINAALTSPTPVPKSISLISPNGEEEVPEGGNLKIQWRSTGQPRINISAEDESGELHPISLNDLSSSYIHDAVTDTYSYKPSPRGFYMNSLPAGSLPPGRYKIVVFDPSTIDPVISDESDEYFNIVPSYYCTPSLQCGEWSACTNNQQTRTCNDGNSCSGNTLTQRQDCGSGTPAPTPSFSDAPMPLASVTAAQNVYNVKPGETVTVPITGRLRGDNLGSWLSRMMFKIVGMSDGVEKFNPHFE